MRILVFGSSGMLGHLTCVYLREQGHAVTDFSYPDKPFEHSVVCDVFALTKIAEFLKNNTFDLVINCVALLIAASRKSQDLAVFINSYFPHWLEHELADMHTRIIQVSTDGVYGESPARDEQAPHLAQSFYAKSKSLGEVINGKDLTVRSSYFGPDRNPRGVGLLNWFLTASGRVTGYRNVIFSGVTSLEFAKFCDQADPAHSGSINLCAKSPIDKFSLLLMIKDVFGIDEIEIDAVQEPKENTVAQSNRIDIGYHQKEYYAMLVELREFMTAHKYLYEHYSFLNH